MSNKKKDKDIKKADIKKHNAKPKKKKRKKKNSIMGFWGQLLVTVAIMLLISIGYGELEKRGIVSDPTASTQGDNSDELSLTQLANSVKAGEVMQIVVRGEKLEIFLQDETQKTAKKEREASLTETLANYGVTPEQMAVPQIDIKRETGFAYWFGIFGPIIFPLFIILLVLWFLRSQMKGAGAMKAFSFGQTRARMIRPDDEKQRITFKDVAGNENAKQELEEIVDFLRQPKKFLDMGAKIPRGVLLTGAPGTGKTLLARAVAGEAKVPYFHLSGSEFVEMFVGVGASRVRDLFAMAKKASPSIVFIDEIDAVGRHRGVGVGGGNDEREQTLNQILVEMDGFEVHEKVIVLAATNRDDVLDRALLRPGRFDRKVLIDLPDRKDRQQILEIHAKKKPLAEGVNFEEVAKRTPGFAGANLESLMNEAAIRAARADKKEISQNDILKSIEKVMIGPKRKNHLHSKVEREVTAYHEAAHALVASVLEYADPVHKISIVARGHAGGYTLKLPDQETKLHTKQQFLDDIAMTLAGYAVEKMVYGEVSTGPSNDLRVATQTARDMITRWGMSDEIGPIALESRGGVVLYGQSGDHRNEHSDVVQAQIDSQVSEIMNTALTRAEQVLKNHTKALQAVVDGLLEKETLEREEYEEIIKKFGLTNIKKEPKKSPEFITS